MKKLSFIFTISTLLINSTMATTPTKFIPSNINPDLYNPYPCVVFKQASEHPAICGYKSVSGRMREYRIFSYTGKIFEMLVADAVELKDRLRESQIETGVFNAHPCKVTEVNGICGYREISPGEIREYVEYIAADGKSTIQMFKEGNFFINKTILHEDTKKVVIEPEYDKGNMAIAIGSAVFAIAAVSVGIHATSKANRKATLSEQMLHESIKGRSDAEIELATLREKQSKLKITQAEIDRLHKERSDADRSLTKVQKKLHAKKPLIAGIPEYIKIRKSRINAGIGTMKIRVKGVAPEATFPKSVKRYRTEDGNHTYVCVRDDSSLYVWILVDNISQPHIVYGAPNGNNVVEFTSLRDATVVDATTGSLFAEPAPETRTIITETQVEIFSTRPSESVRNSEPEPSRNDDNNWAAPSSRETSTNNDTGLSTTSSDTGSSSGSDSW